MKVSIIITAYNYGKYVSRAIWSAINQKFEDDYEIIVVDDGSTDETPILLRAFESQIKVITQENKGLVTACNRGIEASTGKYIVRLDADDVMHEYFLLMTSIILDENEDVGFVYTDRVDVYEKTNQIVRRHLDDFNIFKLIASGIMFRRDALRDVGLYEDLFFEEYDLLLRYCQKYQPYHVKLPLYTYYVHGRNMTLDEERVRAGKQELIDKWGLEKLHQWGFEE